MIKQKNLKGVALLVVIPFFISALNEPQEELSGSQHNATITRQLLPSTLRRAQPITAEIFDNHLSEETPDDSLLSEFNNGTTLSARNPSEGSHVVSTRRPAQDQKKEYVGR